MTPHRTLSEGTDYELMADAKDDQAYVVKLISGDYAGVLYRYTTVKILEGPETATLQYTTEIVDDVGGIILSMDDFYQWTTDVLHDILMSLQDANSVKFEDENGRSINFDSTALDPVRSVHKTDDPAP